MAWAKKGQREPADGVSARHPIKSHSHCNGDWEVSVVAKIRLGDRHRHMKQRLQPLRRFFHKTSPPKKGNFRIIHFRVDGILASKICRGNSHSSGLDEFYWIEFRFHKSHPLSISLPQYEATWLLTGFGDRDRSEQLPESSLGEFFVRKESFYQSIFLTSFVCVSFPDSIWCGVKKEHIFKEHYFEILFRRSASTSLQDQNQSNDD